MAEVIDFPGIDGYCKKCIYHDPKFDTCNNENYNKNAYLVNCVWKRCKYRKIKNDSEK